MSRFIPFQLFKNDSPNLYTRDICPPLSDNQKISIYQEVRRDLFKKYLDLCIHSSNEEYSKNENQCQRVWELLYSESEHNN